MNKNQLDNILKDWDKNLKPEFQDASALKKKILSDIRTGRKTISPENDYFFIRKTLVYNLAAAAAVFIIAIGVFILNFKSSKSGHGAMTPAMLALISKEEMSDVKKIANEVCSLFNDKVDWIIRSGDKMEIKPSESPNGSSSKSRILVRQTVFRKTAKGWEKVHIADIITTTDQQVVFKDDSKDGYLWTHQAGDNVIALEGQMDIKVDGETINLDYSCGQDTETPVMLKTIKNSNSEYIVYQTVNRI